MLRNQKGQGMTEFALILPLLLLLLLGIVEAGRTIWAFITVQQAAREAARFAVTGRPYLNGNTSILAQTPICKYIFDPSHGEYNPLYPEEPDPVTDLGIQPWLCEPETRVEAIKRIAFSQGRNLAINRECFTPEQFYGTDPDTCNQHPGAFGVLIQGQVTTVTITGTLVVQDEPVEDHPGLQGLNIQVNTFYNLQMITPIFDALMGGTYIPLQGRVQLQNEGLDAAAGIEPPPGINPPPTPDPGDTGGSPTTAKINSVSGYTLQQSDAPFIHLEDHLPGSYDIYLEDESAVMYKICANVPILASGQTNPDPFCSLPGAGVPDGTFTLYSTVAGTVSPHEATDPQPVVVLSGGDPFIEVAGGLIWAAGETTDVTLRFHDVISGTTYDVKLYAPDGTTELQTLDTNHSGSSTLPIAWLVPSVSNCPAFGPDACIIKSLDGTTVVAQVNVKINQPQIVLSAPSDQDPANGIAYVLGETVLINLRGHTPGKRYDIKLPNGTVLATSDTNAVGDTTTPVAWTIPQDCGFGGGLPNGSYLATSHPLGSVTPTLASQSFEIFTDPNPDLTIDGGTTWTSGSTINIRVLRHLQNTEHYLLDIEGNRIITGPTSDTFITSSCGDAIISYTIPPTTIAGDYTIASFNMSDTQQDSIVITVLAKPFIHVVEGDSAMPDQTVTIAGTSHIPNTSYAIFYANKFLQGVLTQPDGKFSFPYNLQNLPTSPPPDLTNFNNLGIPYILKSQTVIAPITDVATNTFTILGADLVVTQVKVAPVAPFSTTVPVDIVVQNLLPVTINRFVDVDFYDLDIPDPDPFGPSYLSGYNFPGDIKFWKNTIGPNEIFTFSHTIDVTELGLRSLYGYADVSNNVFENETPGQVANPNNINSAPLLVNCPVLVTSDDFSNGALPGWTLRDYGDGDGVIPGPDLPPSATVSGGVLALRSTGSSTWQSNDNNGGQSLLYRSGTFSSSTGLDVQVMVSNVDWFNKGSYAKGGLEIRDSLSSTSPRVVLGVARNNGASNNPRQVIQAGYRNSGNTMDWVGGDNFWLNNHKVDLPTNGPIWLRITRDTGANGAFNFYYKANPATPPPAVDDDGAQATYWGAAVQSVTVSGIGDAVTVGLFNSPYLSNTAGTSNIDNFSLAVANTALCSQSSQPAEPTFPPKYQVCTQGLSKTSFEENTIADVWGFPGTKPNGVPEPGLVQHFLSGGNIGTRALRTQTFFGFPRTPHFWQKFTMPDYVIQSTTTFNLNLFKRIDDQGTANQVGDQFFAMIVTTDKPNTWTALTDPALVAQGISTNSNWVQLTSQLNVAAGVNLEDYKNTDLYLYFFNNSNLPTTACTGFCRSQFDFDDIELNVCTTEPEPSPISTQLTGQLTLNFSNGTSEGLPFVRVWAYAQGTAQGTQPVYETFSIQNGEFNFYNLPPGLYTIYAQYNLIQDTQIETLADDTTVLLQSSHTSGNPAQAFLNLFTLGPLP